MSVRGLRRWHANGRREKERSKIAWYSGILLGRSQAVDTIYKYATREWSGMVSSGWLSRKREN